MIGLETDTTNIFFASKEKERFWDDAIDLVGCELITDRTRANKFVSSVQTQVRTAAVVSGTRISSPNLIFKFLNNLFLSRNKIF